MGEIRKFSLFCLVGLVLALTAPVSKAQIFSTGVAVTNGTISSLVQNGFITQTDAAFSALSPRALQVQNISTNETITLYYGYVLAGYGASNFIITQSNQYTFPLSNGYVQGQTWTTNFPAFGNKVSVTPYGVFTVTLGSNIVLFQ